MCYTDVASPLISEVPRSFLTRPYLTLPNCLGREFGRGRTDRRRSKHLETKKHYCHIVTFCISCTLFPSGVRLNACGLVGITIITVNKYNTWYLPTYLHIYVDISLVNRPPPGPSSIVKAQKANPPTKQHTEYSIVRSLLCVHPS